MSAIDYLDDKIAERDREIRERGWRATVIRREHLEGVARSLSVLVDSPQSHAVSRELGRMIADEFA